MSEDETILPTGGIEPEKKAEPIVPAVPAPVPPVVVVPPVREAIPLPTPPKETVMPGQDKNNISKILEGIKLPERRDTTATGDEAKPHAPEPEPAILEEHIVKAAPGHPVSNPPVPEKARPNPENTDFSSIVAPLRTLRDDMQTVVRDKKISLVRAASLEEEKKHGQEHLVPEQQEIRTRASHRTRGILFTSLILVVLGVGALLGVLLVMKEQAATPVVAQSSILFSEQSIAFPLDGHSSQNLKDSLAQASTKELGQLGSIERIVPTLNSTSTSGQLQSGPVTLQQFFTALGMSPPQELMQAIGPDFFFGFHVVGTNAPLFVIPVTSYDHAFAGMLAWEPTMDQDLAPIFTSVSPTKLDPNGVPETRTFNDDILRNYDVRELKDDSGNIVLYYSFPTPSILVIAESSYSFTEILSRLQAQREL